MKLETKIAHYPPQVTEDGTYTIQSMKGPQETKFGKAIIMTVSDVCVRTNYGAHTHKILTTTTKRA